MKLCWPFDCAWPAVVVLGLFLCDTNQLTKQTHLRPVGWWRQQMKQANPINMEMAIVVGSRQTCIFLWSLLSENEKTRQRLTDNHSRLSASLSANPIRMNGCRVSNKGSVSGKQTIFLMTAHRWAIEQVHSAKRSTTLRTWSDLHWIVSFHPCSIELCCKSACSTRQLRTLFWSSSEGT